MQNWRARVTRRVDDMESDLIIARALSAPAAPSSEVG